jgi:hypothetical protein
VKRFFPFLGGLIFGALVFGACGIFVGYGLARSDQPAVVVRNITSAAISEVRIETDVGESHRISELLPQKPRRIKISGRDKALWITATTRTGKILTSEKIYVTSQGIIFGIVSEDFVVIDYEL